MGKKAGTREPLEGQRWLAPELRIRENKNQGSRRKGKRGGTISLGQGGATAAAKPRGKGGEGGKKGREKKGEKGIISGREGGRLEKRGPFHRAVRRGEGGENRFQKFAKKRSPTRKLKEKKETPKS